MIINPNNIEKWCFDYFEGNLTYLEKIEFEKFILEHPEHHSEFEAWKDAAESDDEKTPAFIGMEGLLVAAPFYATLAFRLTTITILTVLLGTIGYWQFNGSVDKEYVYQSHGVSMDWSPEDHKLAVVYYFDEAYGEYVVGSNYTTYNNVVENDVFIDEGNSASDDESNSLASMTNDSNITIEEDNHLEDEGGDVVAPVMDDTDLIAFHKSIVVDENTLDVFNENLLSDYQIDEKSLLEHTGLNTLRYGFLNFNNSKVRGLGSEVDSKKGKHNAKLDNHATIVQSKNKSGKTPNYKKKSHFFQNLKGLELGLSNINDPIALAPNSNMIGVNPALAGQLGITRLKLNIRNQWWDTDQSLYRGSIFVDTYFEKIHAGIAYGNEYDMSPNGKQSINTHSFTYAQKFSLSDESTLSLGLTYKLSKGENNSLTNEQMEFYANSPVIVTDSENLWESNMGVATWYSGKYFFGGFNVTNLLGNTFTASHEESTSYIKNINYSIQLGTDYKKSMFSNIVISPYAQYNKVGNHNDLWLGSTVRIKGLVLAGSVATSKSARATLGVQGNKFRITWSSDYSKSLLLDDYAISHELSLRILLGNKNNNWSRYDN